MKNKIEISNNAFTYPMPMVLVGAIVNDKPNFMPVGWVNRVNANPPLIGVAMGKRHHTNKGIHENEEFSICIPNQDLILKTDYCGLVSGEKQDKSQIFDTFFGELEKAPMITACPICMECRLVQAVELPTNTLFIGEIVNAYSEEKFLTNGKPDITKIKPFTLTMPDDQYWAIGEDLGPAWNIGNKLKK